MGFLAQRQQQVEMKKRVLFLGTGAAGILFSAVVSYGLGIPLLALSAYFGWNWFQFRAKNGMRF